MMVTRVSPGSTCLYHSVTQLLESCYAYLTLLTYFNLLTLLTYLPEHFPNHCTQQVPLREEKPSSVTQLLESCYAYLLTYLTLLTILYLLYLLTYPFQNRFMKRSGSGRETRNR